MCDDITLKQQETQLIIDELLADGSDPDALYLIEHHLSSHNFDLLEKAAVEAFKLGFEATDAEEFLDDDDNTLFCCDIVSEIPLDADLINEQISKLYKLCQQLSVNYDGWGTYFEDGSEQDDEAFAEDEPRLH